ncbi:sulfurtransferase TusA family protein [Psychrobacter sp. FDAARGOS_221]|uniref:sulfurtransferase TusA family protein n=1 Tax=Psychrobacter sp. FDAARGOS_221 TaxID=1975705 RepID=UPI000BB59B0E|nr:sulfurtransferase TusA family protein [Psychrobacter sp. FDAARGOS_221]PNK60396.1 sulfurtransferase TusA family protein [Psychrobacter sp. FDAARGOS_221]
MIQLNLSDSEQKQLATDSLQQIKETNPSAQSTLDGVSDEINIAALVDGRGLACPMPLLKTKVALRTLAEGDSVYVLATDPNSQIDLAAFCQQSGLTLQLNTRTDAATEDSLKKLDTIFHLIITKTNGN